MNDVDDGLPDDVLALLRAERPLDPLPPGADAALAAKLALSLGIPVAAAGVAASSLSASSTAGSSFAASSTAASSVAAGATKLGLAALLGKPIVLAALLVGAGSGVLSTIVVQRVTAPAVAPVAASPSSSSSSSSAAPPSSSPAPSSPLPAPSPPSTPASSSSATPAAGPDADSWQLEEPALVRTVQDPAAERRLVEAARAALQQGDVNGAQASLQEHRRRFPRGAFVEEREALGVIAAAQAGDPKAADHARAFRARFPSSLFLPAVDAARAR